MKTGSLEYFFTFFPNEQVESFFANSTIIDLEDVSDDCDGLWSYRIIFESPEYEQLFSLVLDFSGSVSDLKGDNILNQFEGSFSEQWDVINNIFENFQPLLVHAIFFVDRVAN